MNLTGSTPIIVNNKLTRVCGRTFNSALRKAEEDRCELIVYYGMEEDTKVLPSKGLSWANVAAMVRQGKQVQAKLERDGIKTGKGIKGVKTHIVLTASEVGGSVSE